MIYNIQFNTNDPQRAQVLLWLKEEWEKYADNKFAEDGSREEQLDILRQEGIEPWSWWEGQTIARFTRANTYGLNLHQGRQQIGKLIAASIDLLATAIRLHGDMPEPGHPSGYVETTWRALGLFK